MQPTQREWALFALAILVALAAIGGTHALDARDADVRVERAEAEAALHLAEQREASAERTIELEGRMAECELARRHGACPHTGSTVDDARVTSASGAAPVRVGDACRVELGFSDDPLEGCRAIVRCGEQWIYGGPGAGFFDCTVDARGLVRGDDPNASSDGGDPRLVVDRATHTLTISDESPTWSITLASSES